MHDADENRLIIQVIHKVYESCGIQFKRRCFHKVYKGVLLELGRSHMNYGGWVSESGGRPFRLVAEAPENRDDVLEITPKWLKKAGLLDLITEDEVTEVDKHMREDNGETLTDHVRRKLADPKE